MGVGLPMQCARGVAGETVPDWFTGGDMLAAGGFCYRMLGWPTGELLVSRKDSPASARATPGSSRSGIGWVTVGVASRQEAPSASAGYPGRIETVPDWFARGRSKAWWLPLHKTRPDHRCDRPARRPFTALPMKTPDGPFSFATSADSAEVAKEKQTRAARAL